jgi:LPXTG-motif cell wall-anchored protein
MDSKTARLAAIGITVGTLLGLAAVTVPAAADDAAPPATTATTSTTTTPSLASEEVTELRAPSTASASASVVAAFASPTLTVTPRTGLAPGGQTVTVVGRGFDPTRNGGVGVYVVFGPKEPDYATNAETFRSAKWVHPGATPSAGQAPLAADGSFTTTIEVVAGYTTTSGRTIDCRVLGCSVLTMAAHGTPDRSQDAQVAVTFASGGTTAPGTGASSGGGSAPMGTAGPGAPGGSTDGAGTSGAHAVLGSSRARSAGTTSASSGATSTGGPAGSLAQTGTESGPALVVGAGAVLAGAALVVASRRRESGTVRRWPDPTHCS